ncbi:MAG: cyclic 2,3-diphosphoglycerate-synthetase [Rubrobacteraceae bacterium]|nr:cyclic 2,3-diphosphoglycerate-synthetase [Rubrobacteraceae bacterium]
MRALFLIDGEHYPPVVIEAMQSVRQSLEAEGVAAAFLGGTEKIREGTDYGVPLVEDKDPVSLPRSPSTPGRATLAATSS